MKKIIMLSLIAVFAICSLVAMQVTFQESSKTPAGEVHGYVYMTNGNGIPVGTGGQPVRVSLERRDLTVLDLGIHITSSSGHYTIGFPGYTTTEFAYAIVEYYGRTYKAVYTGGTQIDIYVDTNW